MRVVGTAGHVDHGKSALVEALTGIHPDRLKEEREREMTIDLGFAWFTLPGGEEVGIVDVPGHRDFIENMLAGVGGLDAALLVVAADEGVMPQTREHLAILDLLQVPAGIAVLTKVDLAADPHWLDLVEGDVRAALQGTGLKDIPILRVSSRTGAGLPELVRTLEAVLQEQPARPDLGRPRLPVDRVFSMQGFGTVVTGTLTDGQLSLGDEVEILPGGLRARIRGLQTHRKSETVALPGARTAANLSGADVDQVRRGQVVVRPGQYTPTQRLDVRFRLLREASSGLRHGMQVKLFLGTAERMAAARLLELEALEPGQEGWLQLELREPAVAVRGDRFILRRPSPGETLGGGAVIEPHPAGRHKRFDESVLRALESLAAGSPAEVLLQASLALGPAAVKDLVARSRLEVPRAAAGLEELLASGQLAAIGGGRLAVDGDGLVMAAEQWSALKASTAAVLDEYHRSHPLRHGMPREELKSRLRLAPRLFSPILEKLASEGVATSSPKWVALPGHTVRFSPFEQVKVDRLMEQFAAAPHAPPSIKECIAEAGEEVFARLLDSGELVAVSDDVAFRRQEYEAMVERIRAEIQKKGAITLAEVRDLLGSSRRYVQALLEHLDAIGVTVREGEARRLKA
jgi:selenocysteine-specific elongation factor